VKKLIVLGLVVGLAAMVGAHKPEGELFFAFQFTDEALPTMDGHFDDWSFVPETYSIRQDRLFSPSKSIRDVGRGEADPSDFNAHHRWGWNPNNDWIYLATSVFDNHHNIDRDGGPGIMWQDDSIEIRINPQAVPAEEQNVEGAPLNFINYHYAVPPLDGVIENIPSAPDWMFAGSDYVSFGWSFDGEMLGDGDSTYRYEFGTTPVTALGETAATTEFADMEEDDIFHINVTHPDLDAPQPALYNGFWAISPGPGNSPEVDLVLNVLEDMEQTATAVEEVSWGMIKAGLSE
jgi:hypothetical protein